MLWNFGRTQSRCLWWSWSCSAAFFFKFSFNQLFCNLRNSKIKGKLKASFWKLFMFHYEKNNRYTNWSHSKSFWKSNKTQFWNLKGRKIEKRKIVKMLVNCPICSEVLLSSDHLLSTPCGHIFHDSCLTRWISWYDFFFVYFPFAFVPNSKVKSVKFFSSNLNIKQFYMSTMSPRMFIDHNTSHLLARSYISR